MSTSRTRWRSARTTIDASARLEASSEELIEVLGEPVEPRQTWATLAGAYAKYVEPNLIQPTHVFEFPLDLG